MSRCQFPWECVCRNILHVVVIYYCTYLYALKNLPCTVHIWLIVIDLTSITDVHPTMPVIPVWGNKYHRHSVKGTSIHVSEMKENVAQSEQLF